MGLFAPNSGMKTHTSTAAWCVFVSFKTITPPAVQMDRQAGALWGWEGGGGGGVDTIYRDLFAPRAGRAMEDHMPATAARPGGLQPQDIFTLSCADDRTGGQTQEGRVGGFTYKGLVAFRQVGAWRHKPAQHPGPVGLQPPRYLQMTDRAGVLEKGGGGGGEGDLGEVLVTSRGVVHSRQVGIKHHGQQEQKQTKQEGLGDTCTVGVVAALGGGA